MYIFYKYSIRSCYSRVIWFILQYLSNLSEYCKILIYESSCETKRKELWSIIIS